MAKRIPGRWPVGQNNGSVGDLVPFAERLQEIDILWMSRIREMMDKEQR